MKSRQSPSKNISLYIGEETFLIEESLADVVASLGENASMNYASFNAEESKAIDEVISLCNTMPFLADRRLIVLRNIQKLSAAGRKRIFDYALNPSDSTTLIMTIEGIKEDKKIRDELPKSVAVKRFDPLKGTELIDWILKRVTVYGKKMDKDAAFLLADITGANTWFIASEIEKLSLYAGSRPTITIKDVEFLVMRSHEPSVFSFMDALFDRKKDTILRLSEIEAFGIPDMEIISRIENQTIQHYQILFVNQGKKAKVHPFVEKKISGRRSLWKAHELKDLLRQTRKLERGVKTGRSFHTWVALSDIIAQFTISHRAR
ncbi:MAG TPA: DNA polymerase III subunit delta [Deltaproteobacteria bacterium]|nr:DNA polymerase III subunit delta [Deltaproteobacteria bacterium]